MLGKPKKNKEPSLARELSPSLEDYLETIFEFQSDGGVVRVRDIASARDVKAASVSAALKRLHELGLIEYEQRERVVLTSAGLREARRVKSRHEALRRMFHEVLGCTPEEAETDACAMEHSLGERAMDHLTRFLEFVTVCPQGQALIKSFRECGLGQEGDGKAMAGCGTECHEFEQNVQRHKRHSASPFSLAEVAAGERVQVRFIAGRGAVRQRLLDLGILPQSRIEVERVALGGGPVWIRLDGYQLSLRRHEAEAVLVERVSEE
jgi:DtxR family Mn-dependent transcriptional regulator